MGLLLALLLAPKVALAQPPAPHQYIDEYDGPATCAVCHGDVTDEVIHSVHYTWENKMDHYSPVAGTIANINWLGMLNEELGIPAGCGRCHVGSGAMPKSPDEVTPEDTAGIDCLICHSPVYDTSSALPDPDGGRRLATDTGPQRAGRSSGAATDHRELPAVPPERRRRADAEAWCGLCTGI